MSLASPAKQDRIERHLSRQRGAGVRSLASVFGFTFGASCLPAEEPVEGPAYVSEPAAKRRKRENQHDSSESRQVNSHEGEPTSKSERRPNTRRRLESVEEELQVRPVESTRESSFLQIKKTTKRKAGTKARKEKTVTTSGRLVEQDEAPQDEKPQDEAPRRRPRRQAATAAIDKVSKGFFQEEQPIDKMRREPDTGQSKRRATRKPAEAPEIRSNTASDISQGPPPSVEGAISPSRAEPHILESPQQRVKKSGRGRNRRTGVHQTKAASSIPLHRDAIPKATRLPLAETTTNPTTRSVSPDKPFKAPDPSLQENSEHRSSMRLKSPIKPPVDVKKARQKRKSSKFIISKDHPVAESEREFAGAASIDKDVPDLGLLSEPMTKHEVIPSQAEMREDLGQADPVSTKVRLNKPKNDDEMNRGEQIHVSGGPRPEPPAHEAKKRRGPKTGLPGANTVTAKSLVSKKSATAVPALDEVEDVGWLFDHGKTGKQNAPPKPTRPAKRKAIKDTGELSEVDLDDLLSNIATFVPQRLAAAKRGGGHRP